MLVTQFQLFVLSKLPAESIQFSNVKQYRILKEGELKIKNYMDKQIIVDTQDVKTQMLIIDLIEINRQNQPISEFLYKYNYDISSINRLLLDTLIAPLPIDKQKYEQSYYDIVNDKYIFDSRSLEYMHLLINVYLDYVKNTMVHETEKMLDDVRNHGLMTICKNQNSLGINMHIIDQLLETKQNKQLQKNVTIITSLNYPLFSSQAFRIPVDFIQNSKKIQVRKVVIMIWC